MGRRHHGLMVILALVLLAAAPTTISAQDGAVIEVAPTFLSPLAPTPDIYSFGAGGLAQLAFPVGDSPLAVYGRANYAALALKAEAGTVNLISATAGALYDLVALGPMTIGVEAGIGGYAATMGGTDVLFNPSAQAGLRIALGLGGGLELAIRPAYEHHFASRDGAIASFFNGVGASVSVGIAPAQLSTGERRPRIRIEPPRLDPVFPVIYKHYLDQPFGAVTLVNEERSDIENVQVEFVSPQYMSAPQLIGEFDLIRRGERFDVPVTALFSNAVLAITETDAIQAEIRVSYDVGQTSLSASRTVTVTMHDRNTITWDDDRKAAAFISGRDPAVLRLSRNVTSATNGLGAQAVNQNFRSAVALFAALEEHGVEYQVDPESAYATLSESESALDYLQFPSQTLDYRAGDCDDLSILYASLLESVAVQTALITIPGHLYMAFSLGMSEDEARSTFSSVDDLIFVEGETWVPVETTLVGEGFLRAWTTGAAQWREAQGRGVEGFIPIAQAQSVYAATWFDSQNVTVSYPETAVVADRYAAEMDRFVTREVEPLVRPIIARLEESPSARLQNRVGAIYARYGKLDDAQIWFRRAALQNHVPGIVNLGNLSYLGGNLDRAESYYRQAADLSPDNPDVLIGLARVQYDLGRYEDARRNMELAEVLAPERAEEFAYITGGADESSRASDAQRRSIMNWSE